MKSIEFVSWLKFFLKALLHWSDISRCPDHSLSRILWIIKTKLPASSFDRESTFHQHKQQIMQMRKPLKPHSHPSSLFWYPEVSTNSSRTGRCTTATHDVWSRTAPKQAQPPAKPHLLKVEANTPKLLDVKHIWKTSRLLTKCQWFSGKEPKPAYECSVCQEHN